MTETFAELDRKVYFGQSEGRIIWQPRILAWETHRRYLGVPLPDPYNDMNLPEIHRALGCSGRTYRGFGGTFVAIEPETVIHSERQLNETDFEIVTETPVGRMTARERHTPRNPHRIKLKWPVSSEAELKVALWIAEHTEWRWDQEAYDRGMKDWGDLGAPIKCFPRINIQQLYLSLMGVEGAIYALCDYPDTVEAYFRALDESHERLIEALNPSPIEIVNFGDNIHAGTLSRGYFLKYVLPAYQRRCELLHRAGKFIHAHWDGDTKALLPYAQETGLDGIEAITPKPQGDVELEEVKAALGDKMFLIDGIPGILFDDYYSVEELEKCAHRVIELFAPKLILGISDEISYTGDIERIRLVNKIVDDYNASVSRKA